MERNVVQITDIPFAVELYYSRVELNNAEIGKLFGIQTTATITKLKKMAKVKMKELEIPSWNRHTVNTEAAYKAWGLDINNLERRAAKLQKLKGCV